MLHQRVLAVVPVLAVTAIGCGSSSAGSQGDASNNAGKSGQTTASAADRPAARAVARSRVTVSMSEFRFKPNRLAAKAGKVRVTAKNVGRRDHEFVLIRTSAAPGALRLKGDEASEAGAVGEIPEQTAGKSATHTFNLKPGRYAYICNVPGHYKSGMYGTLTVRARVRRT
jgi:uncharacterized cupredoxin-like copper-binding protein